jgi:EamA domain-containing membrane protein RarD
VTAAVVGVVFLKTALSGTQWAGVALVVGAVTALSLRERRPSPVVIEPATAGSFRPPGARTSSREAVEDL